MYNPPQFSDYENVILFDIEKEVLSNDPTIYLGGNASRNNKKIAYYVDENYNNLKYENNNIVNRGLEFNKTVNNETLDNIEEMNYDTGNIEESILLFANLKPVDDGIDVRFIPIFKTYLSGDISNTRCDIILKNSNYPSKEIHSVFYFNSPELDDTTFYHENFIENYEISSSFNSSSLETGWYVETVTQYDIIIDSVTAKWENDEPGNGLLDLEVEMRWYMG